jgi:hypothetical protein
MTSSVVYCVLITEFRNLKYTSFCLVCNVITFVTNLIGILQAVLNLKHVKFEK